MKHFPNSNLRIILEFLKVAYSTRVTLGLTVCIFPFHFVNKSKGVITAEEFFENLHQTFFFILISNTYTQAVFQTQAIFSYQK